MSERFELLHEALQRKYTAIMLIIGILFLVDLYLGCPIMHKIILFQMQLFHVDPRPGHFRMVTIFGKFSSIDPVTKRIDLAIGGIAVAWALWQYVYALFQCLMIKRIK
jgi:hypothetical protein